jgi:hypothetical protein
MWQQDFSIEASASPATVWRLFEDVAGWPAWNAGIAHIALHGPFADGTTFDMQPPGQEMLISRLLRVRPGEGFEDETVVGDVRVLVDHRVEALPGGRSRITYTATVTGPGDAEAAEVGAAVTGDFPDVLAALASLAARREAGAH